MVEKERLGQQQRSINLDLIRCVAVFSVLAVHSLLYIPFYEESFVGKRMWLLTIIRICFMTCVPLFALLSGYLCMNKKLNKQYYKRLIPVLLTYLMACILSLSLAMARGADYGKAEMLRRILNTSGGVVTYSWYIEMYIGLFLLIPFLNVTYHGLESKKNKQSLLLVMLVLTLVPSILNTHDLTSFETFLRPGYPELTHSVFPAWWTFLWPLTYYFLGAYIHEYDIPIPKKWLAPMFVLWVILLGSFLFYRSYGGDYYFEPSITWGGYDRIFHSVLLFLLILKLDLSRLPRWICAVITRISKLSLGIYLCSAATDSFLYYKFLKMIPTTLQKQLMAPVFILASFLLATLASQVIQWILDLPTWLRKWSHG